MEGAISPFFFESPITYIFVKCGCSNYFFLNSANLIYRGTDISKISESPLDFEITRVDCMWDTFALIHYHIELNFNNSNTDWSFTMADSNSFLSSLNSLPIAQENKYLGILRGIFLLNHENVCSVCSLESPH